MKYPINEFFHTMQGEGYFTGSPAFFLRMQGCDVGCKFCDTKYTWSLRSKKTKLESLKPETPQFADATSQEIFELSQTTKHIVITGGEPCLYDLTELTEYLIPRGKTIQIETSATELIKCHPNTWVTLSPKFNNPSNKPILKQCVERANEFKFPVATLADLEIIDKFFEENPLNRRLVWLQPISQGDQATQICLDEARKRNWRISVQVHKYLGLR